VKLIVGLGNPGRSYADTRHNVGWWVLDHLADVWRFDQWRKDHDAQITDGYLGVERVRLLKPQTYMNLSGTALRPYLRRETWSASRDLLIVSDEVQLAVGRFKLAGRGSAGGHNGLESIEAAVGHRDYARLRVGVGPADPTQRKAVLSDYVLDRMGKADRGMVIALLPDLAATIETWIRDGVHLAMTRYNRIGKGARKPDESDSASD
jgi:peptidyl-tRNA hydrolase, PTH1 family